MTRFEIRVTMLCVLVGPMVTGLGTAAAQKEKTAAPQLLIGTFDSRAVAFAYARSDMFNEWLNELTTAAAEAEAAGDSARVKELGDQAQNEHALRSKQVFSTFPAYDVLERIEAEISKIATEARVDVIISKWEIVYQRPGVEFVDVTELMVQLFHLDEDAQKSLQQLLQQEPIPLSEFGKHEEEH
jgi:hypothetical protein